MCGGDGTVMFVVDELLKANCSLENLPIGIIPLGTGNDFSRALGWGGSSPSDIVGENFNKLKNLIMRWIKSKIIPFDIWDIELAVHEGG